MAHDRGRAKVACERVGACLGREIADARAGVNKISFSVTRAKHVDVCGCDVKDIDVGKHSLVIQIADAAARRGTPAHDIGTNPAIAVDPATGAHACDVHPRIGDIPQVHEGLAIIVAENASRSPGGKFRV
jgi:hypothetical protein